MLFFLAFDFLAFDAFLAVTLQVGDGRGDGSLEADLREVGAEDVETDALLGLWTLGAGRFWRVASVGAYLLDCSHGYLFCRTMPMGGSAAGFGAPGKAKWNHRWTQIHTDKTALLRVLLW
jgi:hypothetical protein